MPWIGTTNCETLLILIPAVSSLFLLGPYIKEGKSQAVTAVFAVAMVVILFLAKDVKPIPGEVIAYGRRIATYVNKAQILYTVEGRNSSVAISKWGDGATEVDVNGHVEATTEPYDMKLQRMVGHLPALLHPESEIGAGNRVRRRRFGGNLHALSRHREHYGLRDRAGDSADVDALLRASRITTSITIRRRT